jgi:Tfp pilus assembly protein PilN
MATLFSFVTNPKKVAGIEIKLISDQLLKVAICILEIRKGLVYVLEKKAEEVNITDLAGMFPKDMPIAIALNGKGILHKKVVMEGAQTASTDELLKMAIPTISIKDFYLQKYLFDGGAFISVARRDAVDHLLSDLKRNKLWVASLSFGPFEFNYIIDFLGKQYQNSTIDFASYSLGISSGAINDYKVAQDSGKAQIFNIGDEPLEDQYLLPYAVALNSLVIEGNNPSLEIEEVAFMKDEWKQSRIFRFASAGVLSIFFLGLLVNFFLFTSLSEENAALTSLAGAATQQIDKVDELKKEADEKGQFLANAGWLGTTKNSFYADRIAESVPAGISLTEVNIVPVDVAKSKLEKRVVLKSNTILIKGVCKDPLVLNTWINDLGLLNWVAQVKEQNYTYDHEKHQGLFDFQLIIK